MDASGDLRAAAGAAYRAALAAVRPEALIAAAVRADGRSLLVQGRNLHCPRGRRVVVAVGKAAPGLVAGWRAAAPDWATECWLLAPRGVPIPSRLGADVRVRFGGHPLPDAAGVAATRELLDLAAELGRDDGLMVLLSGGASALLTAPVDGVGLEDVVATTRLLLRAGAPIAELNTVRRALLAAAGGGLARAASPAAVATLVLSDVVAGDRADIGSGPTVPSPTGPGDALDVLARRGLLGRAPSSVVAALRHTRPALPPIAGPWAVLGDNRTAVAAAAEALGEDGFSVSTVAKPLSGEAAFWGRVLGSLARAVRPTKPHAVVLGGETTVTVRGAGRGGRCQELALAAALALAGSSFRVVLAAGTDGVDGAGDAAGALVDGSTVARMRAAGRDPESDLAANDSGPAMAVCGDAVVTGATGTNVADLVLVLAAPEG